MVSVPPNLPGLINTINPKIDVGGGIYLYDIAWLLGFTLAGIVYYVLSVVFPPTETLLDEPITGDDEIAGRKTGELDGEHDDERSIDEKKGEGPKEGIHEVVA